MFCYQQNFFTPTKEVTREQFWALVGAPYTKELIDGLRQRREHAATIIAAAVEEEQPQAKALLKEADGMKKRLPAFIFQATFDVTRSKKGYEGTWRKQAATRLNGLCVLDVDHVEDPKAVYDSWIAEFPDWDKTGVLLVFITPSGHGLKVVFKADPARGNLIDNMNWMARQLGVEADQSCKDASRMSFICTKEDILYINENELFTYENKEFAEKFESQYRGGVSQPTLNFAEVPAGDSGSGNGLPAAQTVGMAAEEDGQADGQGAEPHTDAAASGAALTYRGAPILKIVDSWLHHKQPEAGDRHRTSLALATELRYVCDNDAAKVEAVLRQVPFVKQIIDERNEDVAQTVKYAMEYKFWRTIPKRMAAAISEACGKPADNGGAKTDTPDLAEWGRRIEQLMADYPCLREACKEVPVEGYAAALFVSAALFGTLMTRTWWHFYHQPEVERRLNYGIFIIGDPASGKSFANRLYKLLAAPIRVADQVGYDAINKYKRELKERTTSQKAQKGEPLKKPEVVIRDHPSRTSNAQFILDMTNAVEDVTYRTGDKNDPTAIKRLNLHLLTFDSELDNSTTTQRGGSWIDKQSMELKAFHNEEDGQAYSNNDSVMGIFNVYWNFIYTGTPLSLRRKVTQANFGSGLYSRLGVIPLPPSNYKMMELRTFTKRDYASDATLKQWAFNLDTVCGELPLWPLVEETWQWCNEQMAIAKLGDDQAMEMLLKRVPYYGVCISAPYVLMRHWDEWKERATFTPDERDRELCRFVCEVQFECQMYFFYNFAKHYKEEEITGVADIRHSAAFKNAYNLLPAHFGKDDVMQKFNTASENHACVILSRMAKEGLVQKQKKGAYVKIVKSL